MKKTKRLLDEYRFPGFRPIAKIKGKFGDPKARIISLERCQKKLYVVIAAQFIKVIMTAKHDVFVIYHVVQCEFTWKWTYAVSSVINVVK